MPAARTVLVTAEATTGARLSNALGAARLEAVSVPCIQILPPEDETALQSALEGISAVDWVVVTSRNGARALTSGVAASWAPLPSKPRVAAVGAATARFVEEAGIAVGLVPEVATSRDLAEALVATGVEGLEVMLLLGDIAGAELDLALVAAGARVRRITAYRTVEGPDDPDWARRLLEDGDPLIVTFMSASAARALWSVAGDSLGRHAIVCIGPASAREVERLGGCPARVAAPHDIPGLVQAVIEESRESLGGAP